MVRPVVEARVDRAFVWLEGVGADIEEARGRSPPDLTDEVLGVDPVPPAKVPSDYQLRGSLQGDEQARPL